MVKWVIHKTAYHHIASKHTEVIRHGAERKYFYYECLFVITSYVRHMSYAVQRGPEPSLICMWSLTLKASAPLNNCAFLSVCRTVRLAAISVGVDPSRPTVPTKANLWPEGPEPFHSGSTRRRSCYGERKMYECSKTQIQRKRIRAQLLCSRHKLSSDTINKMALNKMFNFSILEVMQRRMYSDRGCLCSPNYCQLWWLGKEKCKYPC